MPRSARTVPPQAAKAYQVLPVVGPTAGVDLRTSPTLLPPERAQQLVNFSLQEPGALVVRSGFTAFSSVALGSTRAQGAARVYINTGIPNQASTNVTVLAWGQGLYAVTDTGGVTGVYSGLSTREVSFPADRNLVAALDGSSYVVKSTNGVTWTRFGVLHSPTAVPTISTLSTGGVSSGEYQIDFTYKDRDLATESNGSTGSTVTLSASSGAFNVVIPNSTDPQVDAIVVYARKISAGETVLRRVSSQAQSAGVSSTVVVTSTTWTTNDEIPVDHDVPPALSFGVVWKNRWWARSATVTNRLHFTQLFQPQSWPPLFYVDIPFERGDGIQALVPLGDTLLVFGHTKIFVIIGQTSLDFEVRPTLASEDGALGFRAVAVLENGVVHAGAAGVYIFDGASDRLLSYDIEPAWRDLVGNTAAADLAKVAVVYHQRDKELRITVPRRYPSGAAGEWILDMNQTRVGGRPAWTATDRTIGGYISWDGPEIQAGNRGRLFSWNTTTGQLFEEAVGASANGADQTATYAGPGLTLGTHRGRWIDVRGEYEPHTGAASLEAVVDGVSQGTQSVPIGSNLARYGTATYGGSVYAGAGRRQFYQMLPLTADGRTFTMNLTYTGTEQWRLYSYHVGLVPETAPRAFSE